MKTLTILFLTVLCTLPGCNKQPDKGETTLLWNSEWSSNGNRPYEISQDLEDWVSAVNNNNIDDITGHYTQNAIKVVSADSIIQGSDQIAEYYLNGDDKIISIESLFQTIANEKRGIHYELIRFKTEKSKLYTQLVIWKSEGENKVREFETTVQNDLGKEETFNEIISERRNLWIDLCNKHNAENLIRELYSPNTLYFNHRPLVKGTEALIKEYAYMNNDNYQLTLHPIKLVRGNDDIVFEIGQCKGSYNGKYILVWKKEMDGKWKIFIDSNI